MPYKDAEKRRAYHNEYSKKWRQANIEKARSFSRKCMQKWRDENPELAAEKMREWRKRNGDKSLQATQNYKNNNPEKAKAHRIVLMAIKKGELSRLPCEVCGISRSQAHHDNYDNPLSVRWLCQKHHSELHRNIGVKARWKG